MHDERRHRLPGGDAVGRIPGIATLRSRSDRRPRVLGATGGILLLVALASAPTGVVAHGGAARLLVTPDRVSPGGSVEIRGEDLPADSVVALALVSGAGRLELTTADADGEGHVAAVLALPADMPVGEYMLEASVTGMPSLMARIRVEGTPVRTDGEPGAKDEDDLLLIALPSDWQRSLSGPIVTARPLTETLPAGSASGGVAPWALALLGAGVLAAAGVLVSSIVRRRAVKPPK